MIALARAGPTPANLSSASAEALLISTSPTCSRDPAGACAGPALFDPVVTAAAGDFGGDAVCAATGAAASAHSHIAAQKYSRFSMIVLPSARGNLSAFCD